MADDIKKELIATQRVADEIRRKDLESQTAYLESTKSLNKKLKNLQIIFLALMVTLLYRLQK